MTPESWVTVYVALGSNLGNRRMNMDAALATLRRDPKIEVVKVSTFLETDPVGPVCQGKFLNAAVELRTTLRPREVLLRLQEIERSLGRDRKNEIRWGPRVIDLDLLLYGREIIREAGLTVPHPRLCEREFVLEPLGEIAAHVVHPVTLMSVGELLKELRSISA